MPNDFKNQFDKLYAKKKAEGYSFFTVVSVELDNRQVFKCLECNIDTDIIKHSFLLAFKKSRHTMDADQAGVSREEVVKIQKSAQGILAEVFLHFLFMERYNFNVKRYDLERDTFEYSRDEYDLKLFSNEKVYEVESRSSNIRNKSLQTFIQTDVIIGPYVSVAKHSDSYCDFHFRPIYIKELALSQDSTDSC